MTTLIRLVWLPRLNSKALLSETVSVKPTVLDVFGCYNNANDSLSRDQATPFFEWR